MSRLFGTDGVRGLANDHLTVDLAVRLAQSAAIVLARETREQDARPTAVLARDPRISGDFLSAAVAAGLASSGVDVLDAGVLPTPAAAFLTADMGADFGVMISASHNPAPDNGIKFFARGGKKLADDLEDEIQALLDAPKLTPTGGGVGRITVFADAEDRYVLHLMSTFQRDKPLAGLRVVLDCAHGAAAGVSPDAFKLAGAEVIVIGDDPNGMNINDGVGSTHLERLSEVVVGLSADIGIAHDGDADRCLAIDAQGRVVDGDHIMAILALSLKQRGQLKEDTLVTTVMSNLGLKIAMREAGIKLIETAVGDRYVLAALNEHGLTLGGEQSGHVILTDYATTGDGILTGLHLAAIMNETGRSLAELASCMTVYPQVLINVRDVRREQCTTDAGVQEAVAEVVRELGGTGRVLLRPSGTEPVVRVMVEAAEEALAHKYASQLAEVVKLRLSTTAQTELAN